MASYLAAALTRSEGQRQRSQSRQHSGSSRSECRWLRLGGASFEAKPIGTAVSNSRSQAAAIFHFESSRQLSTGLFQESLRSENAVEF